MSWFTVEVDKKGCSPSCVTAVRILEAAYRSCNEFHGLYKTSRRRKSGNSTDAEEDLLRAMLLFAASGLDSVVKQLIRRCLQPVVEQSEEARSRLEKTVARRLRKGDQIDEKLLAALLVSDSHFATSVAVVRDSLLSSSMQATSQLSAVAELFSVSPRDIVHDYNQLNEIFRERNHIAHEMDVDLDQPNRSRRQRPQDTYAEWSGALLSIAERFIQQVDKKLKAT